MNTLCQGNERWMHSSAQDTPLARPWLLCHRVIQTAQACHFQSGPCRFRREPLCDCAPHHDHRRPAIRDKIIICHVTKPKWLLEHRMIRVRADPSEPWAGLVPDEGEFPGTCNHFAAGINLIGARFAPSGSPSPSAERRGCICSSGHVFV
jgi:hypothetical protein